MISSIRFKLFKNRKHNHKKSFWIKIVKIKKWIFNFIFFFLNKIKIYKTGKNRIILENKFLERICIVMKIIKLLKLKKL